MNQNQQDAATHSTLPWTVETVRSMRLKYQLVESGDPDQAISDAHNEAVNNYERVKAQIETSQSNSELWHEELMKEQKRTEKLKALNAELLAACRSGRDEIRAMARDCFTEKKAIQWLDQSERYNQITSTIAKAEALKEGK